MNKLNYITLGNSGDVLIYVPEKNSIYKAYMKSQVYVPHPFHRGDPASRFIAGLIILVIMFLYAYTKLFEFIFSFSVFLCLLLSYVISIICQRTILQKKAYALLKGNLEKIDIKYDVALWNRLYITTKEIVIALIIIIIAAIFVWIVLEDVSIQSGDFDSMCKLMAFLLFVFSGILSGISDLPGRIKLLYRLHKEKQ